MTNPRSWPRERLATTLVALVAIAVIGVLVGLGARGHAASAPRGAAAAPERPCAGATDAVARSLAYVVARRLRDEEHRGDTVSRARHSISADRVLARAVARGDAAAARREALVLLFNHEHIVRLRVLRAGRPLADVGGKLVLTPVFATLRVGARVVGSVEFSVQDDMGYRLLTRRLVGIATVMRYRGRVLMANIGIGGRALPFRGTARIGGRRYLVATITTGHFPTGTLRISLLIPAPAPALARRSCPQVRAQLFAQITRRVYGESLHGPAALSGRASVHASVLLPAAVAAGRRGQVRGSVRRLLRAGHLVRLRAVGRGGRVLADAGIGAPVLAPIDVPLRRHGRTVGHALLGVQSANGFVGVASYLTGADVLVRAGDRQLAGRVRGPAAVPRSGALVWRGRRWHIASFTATRFPSGPVRVYVLSAG